MYNNVPIIKTYEDFVETVNDMVSQCPKSWRRGQSVFNVIDQVFGVARTVQFVDRVDCFYSDDKINEFMEKSWERYCEEKIEETRMKIKSLFK